MPRFRKTLQENFCVITSICLDDCQSYVRHKLSQLFHDDKMLLGLLKKKSMSIFIGVMIPISSHNNKGRAADDDHTIT